MISVGEQARRLEQSRQSGSNESARHFAAETSFIAPRQDRRVPAGCYNMDLVVGTSPATILRKC
jgi:hypothetical protein